jgi:hypothetical protein
MAVAGQRRLGEQAAGDVVGDLDPFEVEEDQVLVDGGALLARAGQQGAVPWIVGLGGVYQAGVDNRSIHLLVQPLQLADGGEQHVRGRAAELVDLPAISSLERLCPLERGVEVAADVRVVHAGVQVGQVPGDVVGAAGGAGVRDGCIAG